jgi:hypothetical protein
MPPVLIEHEKANITLKGVDLRSVRKLLPSSQGVEIEAEEDVIFVGCRTASRMMETLHFLVKSLRSAGYSVNPVNIMPSYVVYEGECFRVH